jgi:hypothetical protein
MDFKIDIYLKKKNIIKTERYITEQHDLALATQRRK